MDLRSVFFNIGLELQAKFRLSAQVNHNGGKGAVREDAFAGFLREYLPKRYSVGSGEVVSSENRVSRQCDIVIYDAEQCPRLLASDSHSIFPIESVYGVVEVKSTLTSEELRKAYDVVRSVKSLASTRSFTLSPVAGFAIGSAPALNLAKGLVGAAKNPEIPSKDDWKI